MESLLDINNFNIIEDEENYYFFRALNMADNEDIETGRILDDNGNYLRIRTDRERYEENPENEPPKYDRNAEISLEQVYDHIKMHYRKDTNCISLSSNSNVSISYGRGYYKDRYVMVKVPKKEFGEKVINAGQYMLQEISKRVNQYISSLNSDGELAETISKIDDSKTSEDLRNVIKARYTSNEKINPSKAKLRNGITYRSPVARISNYKALNQEQSLEKNKIIAKLTLLERSYGMEPIIPYTTNNNLLIRTIGNAFSSLELIHYGDIDKDEIIDLPKEIVDIFSLLQQVDGQDEQLVRELKKEVVQFVIEGRNINLPENSPLLNDYHLRDNISIEEMYELTSGRVEYGIAKSVFKDLFYLAKSQAYAKELANLLNQITGNNRKYEEIIQYISNNGFEIEPEIITRQSNKGVKISESTSLNLKNEEIELIDKVKNLSKEEQIEIIENGGLSDVEHIIGSTFSKAQRSETISKEEYYAEAIFSLYDWKKIGINEFTAQERNNLIAKIRNANCVELYQRLEQQGVVSQNIPLVLLNIITRNNDIDFNEGNQEILNQDLSIERIERFLGYYDVEGTKIQLREYQQRASDKVDELFENERFASVILPTGAGKSFVALAQLMKYKDKRIFYLAPQNEILEQTKDYIIKYIHGQINTLGKNKDEVIAEVFPNLKFSTYPGLLTRIGNEAINKQYDFIVLDELHRTGAKEWGAKLNTLLANQLNTTKVLGITATPRRDVDGINMANEIAERLGYTNREAIRGKHIAMNMSLTNAIKMDLVVNPKLVSCAYSLKTDGSLDKLKDRIDRIDDIQEKNQKISEYEELRRKVEEADGISEILQSNVKEGGKYIVFLPIVDEIEDEDGNVIGRKIGKEKIKAYEEQIAEYFKNSNIIPNFHSMLGEYGDKENAKQLEEFQASNTEKTEFMLVMNKANEGLHIDKLDGLIWLRPMDESSRILYLQQLGRVIYSEDPDKPIKEENRPVVIDLVNNTIKVNWQNEDTELDDIQILNIILDWSERHNGILPNVNSTDREQAGYGDVLKEIQNKYKRYLTKEFDGLNKKKVSEIEEIIRLGSQIDLWQIDLPQKITKQSKKHERGMADKNVGPFELTGVLKDFVELNNQVNSISRSSAVHGVLKIANILKDEGVILGNIKLFKKIEKHPKSILLKEIKQDGIDMQKIIQKHGLNQNYKYGQGIKLLRKAYKGQGNYKITEEEKKEAEKLNLIPERKSMVSKTLKIAEILHEEGLDFSNLQISVTKDGKQQKILLKEIKQKGIDIKKIIEKYELDENYEIGKQIAALRQAYKGKNNYKITEQEKEEAKKLGLIPAYTKSMIAKTLDIAEILHEEGVNLPNIQISVKKDGKQHGMLLKEIKQEGIDIQKIIEENGLDEDFNYGFAIKDLRRAYKGGRQLQNNRRRKGKS